VTAWSHLRRLGQRIRSIGGALAHSAVWLAGHLHGLLSASALSAIAAVLSAIAATVAVSMQYQSSVNAVRPEVVVHFAARMDSNEGGGVFVISSVENIGEGPAFYVRAELRAPGRPPECAILGKKSDPISVLPKAAKRNVEWRGRFRWTCGPMEAFVRLGLLLYYHDVNDNFHTRALNLAASRMGVIPAEQIADYLYIVGRCSTIRSTAWWETLRLWRTSSD